MITNCSLFGACSLAEQMSQTGAYFTANCFETSLGARRELSGQDFCRIEPKNGGRLEAIMHLVERGLEDHNRICVPGGL